MAFARFAALAVSALVTLSAAAKDEHQAHHPPGAASGAAPSQMPPSAAGMQGQMKQMRAMHEKMMAAKTPEERQALMADHMKTMKEGMAMMNGMKGGGMPANPAARQRMMEMRMDMMESMMQMMMDRMPEPAK